MFELAIPLVELLILLVGTGMAVLGRPSSGGLVNWLSKVAENIPIFSGLLNVDQIVKLDRWITHEIGKATATVTRRGVKWFAALTHYQDVVGYWSLYWPVGLYHTVRHLVEHEIPHSINARTGPLSRRIDHAEAQAKATAGYAHSFPNKIHAVDRTKEVTRIERVAMPHAAEWDWVHEHFGTLKKVLAGTAAAAAGIALPLAPALPMPWGQTAKQIRRRLHRLEYVLGATGAAVLVARAIGGITPRCVKSGGLGKTARALCGIPTHFLNDLLGLIADFLVLENICTVLPWLEAAVSEVATPLVVALTDAGSGLCHSTDGPAPAMPVPQLYLPSSVASLTAGV